MKSNAQTHIFYKSAFTAFRWAVGIAAMLASLYAQAYPGESIVLDPVTGDYTITYWDAVYYGDEPTGPPAGLSQTTFVPATKIIPAVRCKFRLDGANDVAYSYTISNGAGAAPDTYLCTTGPNGYAGFTFNAPDASGKHTIAATCISSLCSGSKTSRINVKVDGLATIPGSQFYTFIGDTGKHKDNHYLTPEAASVLWRMAASYHMEAKYRQQRIMRMWRRSWVFFDLPPPLHVNDASLIWGGRFDVNGNWAAPHAGHRRGVVVDVRANSATGAIPLASFDNFQKMAASYYGAEAQVHCTVNPAREPPTCVSTIDGSQDNNRHMHILLLGVDQ